MDAHNYQLNFDTEIQSTEQWLRSGRFSHTKRFYSAEDIVRLRSTVQFPTKSAFSSKKLWELLQNHKKNGTYSHTFGALDPVQSSQMAPYLSSVYVSGWQCSSTASTSNEPGPDFADYPYTTVPNKVDQIFRAQIFHDRKQREAYSRMTPFDISRNPPIDYYRPIIADGDTGFGGVTSTMKLIQLFCEAGAAGVHIEDQKSGTKKCGHMGGKVMISTKEHIERLSAARLMADILQTPLVLVARTDAEAASFIDSNIDDRDHPFILGNTVTGMGPLNRFIEASVNSGINRDTAQISWLEKAQLMTFPELVALRASLSDKAKADLIDNWSILGYSLDEMREEAKKLYSLSDNDLFFDWETPRTAEGYYRVRGGDLMCIARCSAFAPYSDMVWAETSRPHLEQALGIIKRVHSHVGDWVKFAYNCSPSFNWSSSGMTDAEIADFQHILGKAGYVWQFITLAGFHCNGTSVSAFAADYAKRGMLAYVSGIQRPETHIAPELQTHQRWSGTELLDAALATATGGASSTKATQKGITEVQFGAKL